MDYSRICFHCMKEKPSETGACPYCGFRNEEYRAKPHQLPPLTPLNGKYLVGRAIGEGGFGITYLALDTHLEVVVAIKELFLKKISTREQTQTITVNASDAELFAENKKRFLQEARVLAMFHEADHEGIVNVKEHFEENGTAYIVMEYLSGKTLKEQVMRKTLTYAELKHLMAPICHALMKVHQFNVIHMDVSPDNIMMLEDGTAKLLDFGGAKLLTAKEPRNVISLKRGYAPPEQYLRDGKIGAWTDVYAMAATMYYCLTGKRPPDAMERSHGAPLVRPSRLGASLPKRAERALLQALSPEIAQRYATMEQFWNAFAGGARLHPIKAGVLASAAAIAVVGAAIAVHGVPFGADNGGGPGDAPVMEASSAASQPDVDSGSAAEAAAPQYQEGDMVEGLSGIYNVASALDGKTSWSIDRDPQYYPEPTVVTFKSDWLTTEDTAFSYEFVPTGSESRYRIFPADQENGEHRCLEYQPETNRLVMRTESDDNNQLFRIIYVADNLYLIQTYNEAVVGFDLDENGAAVGTPVTARPYGTNSDSRLETWQLETPHEAKKK